MLPYPRHPTPCLRGCISSAISPEGSMIQTEALLKKTKLYKLSASHETNAGETFGDSTEFQALRATCERKAWICQKCPPWTSYQTNTKILIPGLAGYLQ